MVPPIVELVIPRDPKKPMALCVLHSFCVHEVEGQAQWAKPASDLVQALRQRAPGGFVDALLAELARTA